MGLKLATGRYCSIAMPTRDQVQELLDHGHTYETAARELRIPAGQAFMIATGAPADGGDAPRSERAERSKRSPASSQALVNPAQGHPTRNLLVLDWVRERAARELRRPS